ncbi:hypothetical protein AC792_05390 [Arthrobacter sp. RIT-PI-e]|uniref:hypothetical protein n=1 Tax=Arthrobacter sp. RIT-PI-e TaxID=1681197 RepID=UPI0006768E72|nr:hypothetical protein [Arthrobacter sp. RIT-PI-e]KNC19538.1 hypothetical protein AC792_05390 [Arthrobacter sp. RIT-PI-e]
MAVNRAVTAWVARRTGRESSTSAEVDGEALKLKRRDTTKVSGTEMTEVMIEVITAVSRTMPKVRHQLPRVRTHERLTDAQGPVRSSIRVAGATTSLTLVQTRTATAPRANGMITRAE